MFIYPSIFNYEYLLNKFINKINRNMTADLPSSNKIKVINNIFYYWVIENKSIFSKVIIAVLQKANFL